MPIAATRLIRCRCVFAITPGRLLDSTSWLVAGSEHAERALVHFGVAEVRVNKKPAECCHPTGLAEAGTTAQRIHTQAAARSFTLLIRSD